MAQLPTPPISVTITRDQFLALCLQMLYVSGELTPNDITDQMAIKVANAIFDELERRVNPPTY